MTIAAGYVVYRTKFKIDSDLYDRIVADLRSRGDIGENGGEHP